MADCFSKLLGFFLLLSYFLNASEMQASKKIHAHMLIKDYQSAVEEAQKAVKEFPHSKLLWQHLINALAKGEDEKSLMRSWRLFIEKFPDERDNKEVLESLAWSVIEKGVLSSSPLIRVTGLLGACFSQDVKGIVLLERALRDENSLLRAAAVKLATLLFDTCLQDEISRLFKNECVWSVRQECIRAIGDLKILNAQEALFQIISSETSHMEEKVLAIQALVKMSEGIEREHIKALIQSNKVGMRLLACELVAHFEQIGDLELLAPLLVDYHADVRAKCLETLGQLRIKSLAGEGIESLAIKMTLDPDPRVAMTAAWLLLINECGNGQSVLKAYLNHHLPEMRHLASAALAASGKYGLSLTKQMFNEHLDPFVKMNLALGLIGQREQVPDACDCLFQGLTLQKERWAWKQVGCFQVLAPSKLKHDEAIPNYPEAINQLTRLEVLEILAMVHYPKTQKAIKNFLQESKWGISGLASALLLTEGDEHAVEIVNDLLNDPEPNVKVHAALILALWGNGDKVIQFLQEAYFNADRELKGQILEGLGRIGKPSSLFFLAERLQEPHQTLRIIAAAALLECLYH